MSVRNLRIREDTAKYLLNLDVKSAYYDPKTRSELPIPPHAREPALPAGEAPCWTHVTPRGRAPCRARALASGHNAPHSVARRVGRRARRSLVKSSGDARARAALYASSRRSTRAGLASERRPDHRRDDEQDLPREEGRPRLVALEQGARQVRRGRSTWRRRRRSCSSRRPSRTWSTTGRRRGQGCRRSAVAKSKYVEDVLNNNHTGDLGLLFRPRHLPLGLRRRPLDDTSRTALARLARCNARCDRRAHAAAAAVCGKGRRRRRQHAWRCRRPAAGAAAAARSRRARCLGWAAHSCHAVK